MCFPLLAEHRNMPLEDAMKLVASSFEKYIQTQREKAAVPPAGVPSAAPAAGAPPFLPPSADIAYLLNLLADNRQLTIVELGKVIDYLKERKDKLMISEGVHPPVESKLKFLFDVFKLNSFFRLLVLNLTKLQKCTIRTEITLYTTLLSP